MPASRSSSTALMWLFLLFLFGAAVTYVVFSVFVPEPDRGMTFYVTLGLVIGAELIFFLHLTTPSIARSSGGIVSPVTRYMAQAAIFVWFIASVIVAAFALRPANADTITADKIILIDLVLMFFLCVFLYAIYTKGANVTQVNREIGDQRAGYDSSVPELENLMRFANELGKTHSEHAVLAERASKKIDTVKSALSGIIISERKLDSHDTQDWHQKIQAQIAELNTSYTKESLTAEQTRETLEKIGKQAEAITETLKLRERSLAAKGGT